MRKGSDSQPGRAGARSGSFAATDAELRRALAASREGEDERQERKAWVRTMEEAQWSEPREDSLGSAAEE